MVRALQPADPRLIGPYRLVGLLGSGGMGRVFLAMSAGGRPVAVKMIRAELAADPDFRSRFSREVAAARRVNGLFTALVVDADVDAQIPWLATAYVAGPSLAETVKDHGPLSAKSVLALAAGLAEGLSAIHSAGVVHGDLKPSNVLLAEDGPRVIDFGISHAAETAPLTHPGLVMGSPGFMSPEQAQGKKVGPLSDVFSLGTVLAFAASGRRPFGMGSPVELLDRVVHGAPDLEGVPAEVRPLVERCMVKDPGQRPTAAVLLTEMGAAQATTDWLPESIVRMIRRDLPPRGEEDRKGSTGVGGTSTTLGSAAQEAAPAPTASAPADRTRAADQAGTADQTQTGERTHTEDQAPSAGHDTDAQDYVDTGQYEPPGAPPPPEGQVPAGPADPVPPEDQLQSADQPLRPDSPPPGEGEDRPRDGGLWPLLVAACLIGGLLLASGAAGAALVELTRHLTAASAGSQGPSGTATSAGLPAEVNTSPTAPPSSSSQPPQITNFYTYQQGQMMYFSVYYSDPGNNAAGFGFAGADGSSIGSQIHSFSSPGNGIIEPGSVTYPINQGCGTSQPHSNSVRFWVYDTAGVRSKPVLIHLNCAT